MKRHIRFKTIFTVLFLCAVLLLSACSLKPEEIISNFALSRTELALLTGESAALSLADLEIVEVENYSVSWSSDAPEVAVVDSFGVVSGVSSGTCTVTATLTAGEVTADYSCNVTVTQYVPVLAAISFAANIYALGDGQTLNLTDELVFYPVDAPRPELTWTSSSPAIASVVNGVVSPVSEGMATITATTADGALVATCMVQVSGIAVEATGVSLSNDKITLKEGRTFLLTAIVTPSNATGHSISWTSSKPSVATVSGGTVTAVSAGEATITARLTAGDGKSYKATCKVTVEKRADPNAATKVTLTPASLSILEGSLDTYKFDVFVTPSTCPDPATWSTNNPEMITIDPVTGLFTVTGSLNGNDMVAVVVTCTVGEVSGTAVVYVMAPVPELVLDVTEKILYTHGPDASFELVAAITTSQELPDVVWVSSDPAVAEVDAEGNVTAKGIGTCTITAMAANDPALTASCTVTVSAPPYVVVEVGQTVPIDPNLLPSDPKNWTYDPTFIFVDEVNRTVTGLKETINGSLPLIVFSEGDYTKAYTIPIYIMASTAPPPPEDPTTSTDSSGTTDSGTTDSGTPTDPDTNTDTVTDVTDTVTDVTDTNTGTVTDPVSDPDPVTQTDIVSTEASVTGGVTDTGTPIDVPTDTGTPVDTGTTVDLP